jgi:prephenate dehydrogenase/GNAT superfamily N-acetyltransferase
VAGAPDPPFARIAIVGFGLIGGSLAKAIRQRYAGSTIVAIDCKPVVETVLQARAADVGGDELSAASGADLVVLAAPVRQNIDAIRRLAAAHPGTALVTDVGSTKRETIDAARGLPERLRFVGGHPLAGAATGGLGAARADLFDARPWILTPTGAVDDPSFRRLRELLTAIGARTAVMSPDEHDRLMAYLSELPQFVVSALMHVVGKRAGKGGLAFAGRGLHDTTRLATSPAGIWRDIAATNVGPLKDALQEMIGTLTRLERDLGDGAALAEIFASAERWKHTLDAVGPANGPAAKAPAETATRTYLEMREPSALRPAGTLPPDARVERVFECPPSFARFLYVEVGRKYRWTDRLVWTDEDFERYLRDPNVSLWLLTVRGAPAGYFELRMEADASVEIVYFGLLDEFTGRRLGAALLTTTVERAWALGASRVWLHTCSFDHPAALPNYIARGFAPFKTEEYVPAVLP